MAIIPKKLTVAQVIARFIADHNSPAVFQLSGGMIAYITDSISQLGQTRLVSNRHEQASGFAAEGATRVSGRPAVALGTSGPGATNLITPLASCYFDSTPAIFITGQVKKSEIKKSSKQRQNGFQELDICGMVQGISKKTFRLLDPQETERILQEAWDVAQSDRPGPVLIDIPIDVQQEVFNTPANMESSRDQTSSKLSKESVINLNRILSESKAPLVMVGGGVRSSGAVNDLRKFLNRTGLPFVATLMGLDAIDMDSPNYLGYIGSYGNRWANEALELADVVIVLGARLDSRQIGSKQRFYSGKRIVIRVEIDDFECEEDTDSVIRIGRDLDEFLSTEFQFKDMSEWRDFVLEIQNLKKLRSQTGEQTTKITLNPNQLFEEISSVFRNSNGYVVDVGQHQMWAAQSIHVGMNQRFLTSGGLGAMGFAIPAAIGAAIAKNGKWICIVGDGCAQLSLPELQTISQEKLDIVICIINNDQHGMVAQFQEQYMDSRFIGTRDGFTNPNFSQIAHAFGIENYLLVETVNNLEEFQSNILKFSEGPALIEFKIDQRAKALPKNNFSAFE